MPSQTVPDSYASPGFCRIDREGIHVLNRYRGAHLIRWDEVKGIEKPLGNCRHDYLKVVTAAKNFTNVVPVADRDHADRAAKVIARFRPDLSIN